MPRSLQFNALAFSLPQVLAWNIAAGCLQSPRGHIPSRFAGRSPLLLWR
jgi:hypothetical protein